MENTYSALQFDDGGLYLTDEQMRRIANDKIVMVQYADEYFHLCRCEPISKSDTFEICYSTNWSPQPPVMHLHFNGKTLCNRVMNDLWRIEKKYEWIRRCKVCESLINKGK